MTDPFELIDGHAPEIALSALADGEDEIVPDLVRAHVDTCDVCAGKIGVLARAAIDVTALLAASDPVRMPSPLADVRVPWRIVGAGLAVAVVGTMLNLGESNGSWLATVPSLLRSAPLFLKSVLGMIVRVMGERGEGVALVSATASLALCALTVMVARKRFLPAKQGSS